jgi:hypothetical protein
MDFDDAAKMLTPQDFANPSAVREKLQEIHADHPQKLALANLHLTAAEQALSQLAQLGHRLVISLEDQLPALQYPKMLYHDLHPETVVDSSAAEEALLAAGWREHPTLSGKSFINSPVDDNS